MAKPIKSLQLHYQMIQFLIISDVASESNIFFEFQTAVYGKIKILVLSKELIKVEFPPWKV